MAPWQFPHKPQTQGEVNVKLTSFKSRTVQERSKILWVGRWTIDFQKVGIIDSIQNIPHPWPHESPPPLPVDLKDPHPQGPNDGTLANQRSMALGALPRLRTWHLCRGFMAGWKIHHFGWYIYQQQIGIFQPTICSCTGGVPSKIQVWIGTYTIPIDPSWVTKVWLFVS